jgi:hypothetical protein
MEGRAMERVKIKSAMGARRRAIETVGRAR